MLITKICTSEVYKRRSPSEVQTCYSSNGFKEVLKQSKTKKKAEREYFNFIRTRLTTKESLFKIEHNFKTPLKNKYRHETLYIKLSGHGHEGGGGARFCEK